VSKGKQKKAWPLQNYERNENEPPKRFGNRID
jgi:hypothetical protein